MMRKNSSGVRRLSIVVGAVVGLSSWISKNPSTMTGMVLDLAVGFVFGWGAVQLVAWVIRGFASDHNGRSTNKPD